MSEESSSPTHNNAPLKPEQRDWTQEAFLQAYRETGNIKYSCKEANIDRSTYYYWRDHDESFKAKLPSAKEEACDTLELAAYERAVKGVPSHVVSNGRVVYVEVPVLDKEGKETFDEEGRPIIKREPLLERKYSDALLSLLLKSNLPEKYKDRREEQVKQSVDVKFYLPEKNNGS